MSALHASTPYTAHSGPDGWSIRDAEGHVITYIDSSTAETDERAEADAALIVRACNAHYDLVDALREIATFTECDLKAPNGKHYNINIGDIPRAALAKAGAE